MKKILDVALGIVTGIGGFLEVGSITTAAQAGASFGYRLVWALAVGTFGLVVLSEMSGRLAAASGRTLADAMRERFGFRFFLLPLVVVLLVSFLVLASELGGVAPAIQMATDVSLRWCVLYNLRRSSSRTSGQVTPSRSESKISEPAFGISRRRTV